MSLFIRVEQMWILGWMTPSGKKGKNTLSRRFFTRLFFILPFRTHTPSSGSYHLLLLHVIIQVGHLVLLIPISVSVNRGRNESLWNDSNWGRGNCTWAYPQDRSELGEVQREPPAEPTLNSAIQLPNSAAIALLPSVCTIKEVQHTGTPNNKPPAWSSSLMLERWGGHHLIWLCFCFL